MLWPGRPQQIYLAYSHWACSWMCSTGRMPADPRAWKSDLYCTSFADHVTSWRTQLLTVGLVLYSYKKGNPLVFFTRKLSSFLWFVPRLSPFWKNIFLFQRILMKPRSIPLFIGGIGQFWRKIFLKIQGIGSARAFHSLCIRPFTARLRIVKNTPRMVYMYCTSWTY